MFEIQDISNDLFKIGKFTYSKGDYYIEYKNLFGIKDGIQLKNKYTQQYIFDEFITYNKFTYNSSSFTSNEELTNILANIITPFSIDINSLATTGSNIFNGNQFISGTLNINNGITGSLYNYISNHSSSIKNINTISYITESIFELTTPISGNLYIIEESSHTGYQSRYDNIITQSLIANIDNIIQFSGSLYSNGNLELLNNQTKITPIQEGDLIIVDFSFIVITPSGTNNYINIFLKSGELIIRNQNHILMKGAGLEDTVSVSFSIPIGNWLMNNDTYFYINPTTNMDIKERYMVVSRIHKVNNKNLKLYIS